VNKLLISKHHPYSIYYSNPNNLENCEKRTLNLFLKYERLFSGYPDGQIKDFYYLSDPDSFENKIINLVIYKTHTNIIDSISPKVLNLLEIDSDNYSSYSKRAAFCVFGWDQVYGENV